MNEKQSTLQLTESVAALKAITPEARDSIPHDSLVEQDMVIINQLPFKVGRESRVKSIEGKQVKTERSKLGDREPNNDLYLIDICRPLHISREHFQIEIDSSGYILIDRGSACGTTVGATTIGGHDSGGGIKLNDGDIIAVGAKGTFYQFKFIVFESQG
jgi:hypothetical protein